MGRRSDHHDDNKSFEEKNDEVKKVKEQVVEEHQNKEKQKKQVQNEAKKEGQQKGQQGAEKNFKKALDAVGKETIKKDQFLSLAEDYRKNSAEKAKSDNEAKVSIAQIEADTKVTLAKISAGYYTDENHLFGRFSKRDSENDAQQKSKPSNKKALKVDVTKSGLLAIGMITGTLLALVGMVVFALV